MPFQEWSEKNPQTITNMHCQWISMILLKKENISQSTDLRPWKKQTKIFRQQMNDGILQYYEIKLDEQWIEKMWREKPNDKWHMASANCLVECT